MKNPDSISLNVIHPNMNQADIGSAVFGDYCFSAGGVNSGCVNSDDVNTSGVNSGCVNSDDVYTSDVNSSVHEPGILLTPAPGLAQPTEFYEDF